MKTYSTFLDYVMPYAPGATVAMATLELKNTCIEFCEKTLFLQQDLDPQPLIVNAPEYELDPDGDYKVVDVIEAWSGDQFLIPKSLEELTRIYRVTNWQDLVGNPYYFYRPTPDILRLVPMPQLTQQNYLKIRVAVAPTRASTTVDDSVFERWLEQVAYGARARLYDTVNQPYYDPKAAAIYTKRFNDACADIRRRVNMGNVRASSKVEFQRWV